MISQNSIEDAVAAMERLVENYGEAGGDFLFDANYLLGQAKEKNKDFRQLPSITSLPLTILRGMKMLMTPE